MYAQECDTLFSMTRRVIFAPDEYYHLYNRGTEKRTIFLSDSDYRRFQSLLYLCNRSAAADLKTQGRTLEEVVSLGSPGGETLVDVCVYCLMPNHFHLLVRAKSEDGISQFMQKLLTGYTMYFNKRKERNGVLFQGKFKARHADTDTYLKYLIAYIHLNPVKLIDPEWKERGITNLSATEEYLHKYRYSSYLDHLGRTRTEGMILNKEALPEYFSSPEDLISDAREWLTYNAS